ncbi:uncharacterized protein AKAW2_11061A [Aspergillus luchuensis]|uniref:Uncharacterized protein n=2 Tax=Aspergillus kawachii TaxID=1069201 RepID=A0A7R7W0D6_ASPKA|nr:uncharacterized protein AKAW2_11061A [Aspergillus luchuensis]BCR94015.1 hypothetical protein AKAW2_11061A [Aspergillus luchuensis]BCS06626.1 hypothetical protein ALUC_11007A [Aspergillus luchuensis]
MNTNMHMNLSPCGKDSRATSPPPYVEFHDPFSAASLAYQPQKSLCLNMDTETSPGRPEPPALAVPMTPSSPSWPVHPDPCQFQDQPFMRTGTEEVPEPASDLCPDLLDSWYPRYLACTQFFVSYAQHTPTVQSLAAFLNIRLPCQQSGAQATHPSLRAYIRRLIVTAQDSPEVLGAFFGEDWVGGVGSLVKQERVNYLFTAKSGGWASIKAAYDILPDEQTPFLRPLRAAAEEELREAEARWSEWLAMEDWMVGPRSPW